ncbi:Metallo-dependent phosphatase [Trametes meyenii]|nr:Metallo-dependent phosphatase [Trametes meyenii]
MDFTTRTNMQADLCRSAINEPIDAPPERLPPASLAPSMSLDVLQGRDAPETASRAAVYDSYSALDIPRHPGPGWTRFVCISDNHSRIFTVPPGDVLLHAGDLCRRGTLKDLQVTLDWLRRLPHPVKVFMAGNHDVCLDKEYERDGALYYRRPSNLQAEDVTAARALVRSDSMREAGMHYLEHESAIYTAKSGRSYTIYASPAAPRFHSVGSFQYTPGCGKEIYARIPPAVDVLMTHCPAFGLCDVSKRGEPAGCPELAARLEDEDLRSCRLHVCGHIHEAHGVVVVGRSERNPDGRITVNAALPKAPLPVIVDLKD